jgi:hypothetical protein
MFFLSQSAKPSLDDWPATPTIQVYDKKVEVELEQRGDINGLQRLRLLHNSRDQGWQFVSQISEFIVTEFDIRRIVQKEISPRRN